MEIDGEWFRKKLEAKRKSQAALARHLEVPPSTVTKMLNGSRKVKLDEADQIARFLSVSTEDVLSHLGVEFGGDTKKLSISSVIDGAGVVRPSPAPLEVSTETMDMLKANIPRDRRDNFQVAQIRATKGSLGLLDDTLLLFEEPQKMTPGRASVLSVSKLRDGTMVLGKVKEWRTTGEATIETMNGEKSNVNIAASTPVLLIVP